MDSKIECEIVQDLLFSYADGVLKPNSQKWVEKHITVCPNCQAKLLEIKKEQNQHYETQKKEIDYLKKIRRKNRLQSCFGAIFLLSVIFVGIYMYKWAILVRIAGNIEHQFENENFSIETIHKIGFEEDGILISKIWYKNGKYKKTSYLEKDDQILQQFDTEYGNLTNSAKEDYLVNDIEKKVTREIWSLDKSKNDFLIAPNPIHLSNKTGYQIARLGAPFYTKISTDHEVIGKPYYVLEMDPGKIWVDCETGLPIMSFGYSSVTNYYKNTKIPLRQTETISEYHYEFGTVTDKEVEMPELSDYEWIDWEWEKHILKQN